jgi:twitching motility protein PilT
MNSALVHLLREKKIGLADAKAATTDRLGFADACYSAMIEAV